MVRKLSWPIRFCKEEVQSIPRPKFNPMEFIQPTSGRRERSAGVVSQGGGWRRLHWLSLAWATDTRYLSTYMPTYVQTYLTRSIVTGLPWLPVAKDPKMELEHLGLGSWSQGLKEEPCCDCLAIFLSLFSLLTPPETRPGPLSWADLTRLVVFGARLGVGLSCLVLCLVCYVIIVCPGRLGLLLPRR